MGGALLGGLIGSGWVKPEQVAVVELVAERRAELAEEFPGVTVLGRPRPVCWSTPVNAWPVRCWPSSPMPPKAPAGCWAPSA